MSRGIRSLSVITTGLHRGLERQILLSVNTPAIQAATYEPQARPRIPSPESVRFYEWLDVGDAAGGDGLEVGDAVDGDGLGVDEAVGVGERLVLGV